MSLEDAIKEVAKAIQSHADAIREDIAQRNVDNEALRCLMRVEYEEDEEPAPVVSLAEKRKEKQADALLTVYADTKKAETAESEYVPGFNPNDEPITKVQGVPLEEVEKQMDEVAEVQKALDETMTEDYVIEVFKKAMLPKPGVSQEENKARVKDILKKYGGGARLLDNNKITVKQEKWQDFTRELLS